MCFPVENEAKCLKRAGKYSRPRLFWHCTLGSRLVSLFQGATTSISSSSPNLETRDVCKWKANPFDPAQIAWWILHELPGVKQTHSHCWKALAEAVHFDFHLPMMEGNSLRNKMVSFAVYLSIFFGDCIASSDGVSGNSSKDLAISGLSFVSGAID